MTTRLPGDAGATRCRFGRRGACAAILACLPGLLGPAGVRAQEAGPAPARSAASDQPVPGEVRVALQPQQYDGYPIARVFYDLLGGTGSAEKDAALRAEIERLLGAVTSGRFSVPVAEGAVAAVRRLAGVDSASYSIYASSHPGEIVFVLSATFATARDPASRGTLATGRAGDLPVLLENARQLLRVQLNTGVGVYSDYNPWFASPATYTARSPIALDPPGAGSTSWAEAWVEYGLAGATQLGASRAYVYGEVTGLTSGSTGQDLFRSDTRSKTLLEKAHAGLLWSDPDGGISGRFAVGRQNWQLNNGFLFSRFAAGANAGPNPGLYLNPRTTYEQSVLAEIKSGRFSVEYFDVDPAELDDFDSGTRFQGLNVSWLDKESWDLGLVAYRVPESNTTFRTPQGGVVPRDGQRTFNLRVGRNRVAGLDGLDARAEYAEQEHSDADVAAEAWYAQLGYTAKGLRLQPSLTYRYASFSGDDPATSRREAFDAPLSSGLDEWVQGVSFKKVVTNSNLESHRLRLNLVQSPRINYTIDWFHLAADVALPSGATNYGSELDFVVRWAISKQLYFLGVAGVAWPDEIIREQTGGAARQWVTMQASLFWGL